MDVLHFFNQRHQIIHTTSVDNLVAGLTDDQLRARPHGLNSIAWLLWHIARVEDLTINGFVADRPQVLQIGRWNERLGIERRDVGAGMTSAEVDQLSQRIDLEAIRHYLVAVAQATAAVAGDLSPADLDAVVAPTRVREILRTEAALLPAGREVGDFWANNQPCGWFLLQTALLHPYGHLFDCQMVRGLLGM